jgi:hypothetical protein
MLTSIEVHFPGVKTIHLPKGRQDLFPTHLSANTSVIHDLPTDYEECGSCGYDHGYNPFESTQAHQREAQELRGQDSEAQDNVFEQYHHD